MHQVLGTVLASSLLLLAAGCGDDAADAGPRAQDPSATTTRSPGQDQDQGQDQSQVPVPTSSPSRPPSEGLEKLRVVGVVTGVGDCVVVRDDNGTTWTMTGDRAGDLVLDERVQVTGTPLLAATGCGGAPVEVAQVVVLPVPG